MAFIISKENSRANQAFAFQTSYTTKLDPKAIDDYTDFFTSIGVPSNSKMGVVFDIIHAYPFINGNGHGFTADVLRNSAMSFLNSLIDINHDKSYIVGSIVKVDLIENDTSPLTLRLVGVLDKDIMAQWSIEDLLNEDWSMECRYNNYVYSINNKIYQPKDVPEIDAQFNDIAEGRAVFDKNGNRVNLLLGGVNGTVDFNGCGLIIWGEGADPLAETHLQVAHDKTKGVKNNLKTYTEEEFNQAQAALQKEIDKLKDELQIAQANLAEKNNEIAELDIKVKTAEASLITEKERADKAENELQKQAIAKLIEERRQILTNKNYPEDRIEKKMEWLGKASKEEFNSFVEEVEALYASAQKQAQAQLQAVGFQGYASINLTGKDFENNKNNTSSEPDLSIML